MRKHGYWDLYNMETCILIESALPIPEYIESQHSHKLFFRIWKVRDRVKWSKRNEVTGKFLDSGRRSIHTAVDSFPPLLVWRTMQSRNLGCSLGEEGWENKTWSRSLPPTKFCRKEYLALIFLLPHITEQLWTYWIYYWLPQEQGS